MFSGVLYTLFLYPYVHEYHASHVVSPKCTNVQLFVIDCIITNNTGTYLTFHEHILCLFIKQQIGILSFDHQFIKTV